MKRLDSVDAFRGLTVALMVVVNFMMPGEAYPILLHAPWHGCTLADLVFPFFLYIVGISTGLFITACHEKGIARSEILTKIVKRSCLLFGLGLAINMLPNHFDLHYLRIFGVLQRIALCYCVGSILFLYTKPGTQILIFSVILIGYWLALLFIPVPDFGSYQLTMEGSLAGYLDRLLLSSQHLLNKHYDPEGLLTTLPAIATTIAGQLTACFLMRKQEPIQVIYGLLLSGTLLLGTGWLWSFSFPLNKSLWTSSYTLWTLGLACLSFAVCYWLIEMRSFKNQFYPIILFGQEALFIFVLHVLYLKIQFQIKIAGQSGAAINMNQFLTEKLFGHSPNPRASFLYSILVLFVLFTLLLAKKRYRKRGIQP